MERAIRAMRHAQRQLNEAHMAATDALATFDHIDADKSRSTDERIAARSLKQETLVYCEHLRHALADYPQACAPRNTGDVMTRLHAELHMLLQPKSTPAPLRTAKSMLDDRRRRKLQTSNYQPSPHPGPVQRSTELSCPILN